MSGEFSKRNYSFPQTAKTPGNLLNLSMKEGRKFKSEPRDVKGLFSIQSLVNNTEADSGASSGTDDESNPTKEEFSGEKNSLKGLLELLFQTLRQAPPR